jgi:hypothetical protein
MVLAIVTVFFAGMALGSGQFAHKSVSDAVKGFGCRPLAAVRHARAAGVRKPPREETAMGEGAAVSRALWGFERRGWCI